MDETLRIAEKMEQSAEPLWQGQTEADGPPAISRFFLCGLCRRGLLPGRLQKTQPVLVS